MIDSSPIESWEGVGAIFSFGAGSGMTVFLFWVTVALCIVPLYYTLKTEKEHEDKQK